MIEFGLLLSNLGVSEGGLSVQEPKIRVIRPKIWKFDGQFCDELRGGCNSRYIRHFHGVIELKFGKKYHLTESRSVYVLEKSLNVFRRGHQYRGQRTDSNETRVDSFQYIYFFIRQTSYIII